jgi:hypothetical protein
MWNAMQLSINREYPLIPQFISKMASYYIPSPLRLYHITMNVLCLSVICDITWLLDLILKSQDLRKFKEVTFQRWSLIRPIENIECFEICVEDKNGKFIASFDIEKKYFIYDHVCLCFFNGSIFLSEELSYSVE